MDIKAFLFYIISTVLLLSAVRVVTTRNSIHSVLFLVLTFTQASIIWMFLKAEFLSISLVLVYVGAVMVLFLFVVMMLDVGKEVVVQVARKHLPVAGAVALVIAVEMSMILMSGSGVGEAALSQIPKSSSMSNTKALGLLMYTEYFYALEVAAAILLVAMIVAIALTMRHRKDRKAIDPGSQVTVKAKDRLTVVSFPANGN